MKEGLKFKDIVYEHQDYVKTQEEVDKLTEKVKSAQSYEQVREIIIQREEMYKEVLTHTYIAYIRSFQDSTDEYYQKEMPYAMQGMASIQEEEFSKALVESPFAGDIDREFGPQYLDRTRNSIRLYSQGTELRIKEEELSAAYQQLKAGLVFPWQGREISEGELLVYFDSKDREERRQARMVSYETYLSHKDEFISLLKELVSVRNEMARLNGFDNFLDYANLRHGRSQYGEKELNAFCDQVKKDLVPFAAIYHKAQAKRLGLDKLKSYDYSIIFPDGNPVPAGDEEFLTEAASKMYHGLSEEAGKLFDRMVEGGLLDIKSSPNKIAGIGFCVELPAIEEQFIFSNCNGTQGDVAVFTHEIGHALQGYLSAESQPLLEYNQPMTDVAEIPSKTMELFAYPYADEFFGKDAKKFTFAHLQEALSEIMAYCQVNDFENYLYLHPEASIEELAEEFDRVTKLYNPEMDNEEFSCYLKQGAGVFRSMGVYMFPKYLISYALSEMGALEFKKRLEENPEAAWEDYVKLLRAGGSKGYKELLELANLKPAYEEGTVKNAISAAQEQILSYLRKEGTLE